MWRLGPSEAYPCTRRFAEMVFRLQKRTKLLVEWEWGKQNAGETICREGKERKEREKIEGREGREGREGSERSERSEREDARMQEEWK